MEYCNGYCIFEKRMIIILLLFLARKAFCNFVTDFKIAWLWLHFTLEFVVVVFSFVVAIVAVPPSLSFAAYFSYFLFILICFVVVGYGSIKSNTHTDTCCNEDGKKKLIENEYRTRSEANFSFGGQYFATE